MNDYICCMCDYIASYEDVSDGDFDTYNNLCYPCSITYEEDQKNVNYTLDGRRYADPITNPEYRHLVNENNGSIWLQALYDVYSNLCYHVNTTNLNTKIKQMNYNYHAYSRIILREIDLRGPNIKNILKN